MSKLHRGRIQSQGGNMEESEPWSQAKPLSAKDGLLKTSNLENRHGKKEKEVRKLAFQKAKNFINKSKDNGGVNHPVRKSFLVKNSRDKRIDIEVIQGIAFK